jgi:hypothetical protein
MSAEIVARRREAMIAAILRRLEGCRTIAVGASSPLPGTAALLARAKWGARVLMLGSRRHNSFTDGGRELFDCAAQGRIDAFFLSGGQIDGSANINLIGVGDYPGALKQRFPGSFGSAYLYFVVPRVILFREEHETRVHARTRGRGERARGLATGGLPPGRAGGAGHGALRVRLRPHARPLRAGERPCRARAPRACGTRPASTIDAPDGSPADRRAVDRGPGALAGLRSSTSRACSAGPTARWCCPTTAPRSSSSSRRRATRCATGARPSTRMATRPTSSA